MTLGKLMFVVGFLVLAAASMYADARWRRWVNERKAERDRSQNDFR